MNDGVSLHGPRARAQRRRHADQRHDHRRALRAGPRAPAGSSTSPRPCRSPPGIGANQDRPSPNQAVEQVLVAAGVDPTRATWTKGTWTKASWTKALMDEGVVDEGFLDQGRPGRPTASPRPGRSRPYTCDTCASGSSTVTSTRAVSTPVHLVERSGE